MLWAPGPTRTSTCPLSSSQLQILSSSHWRRPCVTWHAWPIQHRLWCVSMQLHSFPVVMLLVLLVLPCLACGALACIGCRNHKFLPLLPGLQNCRSFAGLKAVDVGLTRQLIATFDGGAQAVLGVALSGKCYTENEFRHFRQSDDDEMQ